MGKHKSKLKQMAEDGNPWAIETLARMQAQGRAAAQHGRELQRAKAQGTLYGGDGPPWEAPPKDPLFAEAMRDARDIREWTDGSRVAAWRIYRLAQALAAAGRRGNGIPAENQ